MTLYILLSIFFLSQGYSVCKEFIISIKAIAKEAGLIFDRIMDYIEKDGKVFWERREIE